MINPYGRESNQLLSVLLWHFVAVFRPKVLTTVFDLIVQQIIPWWPPGTPKTNEFVKPAPGEGCRELLRDHLEGVPGDGGGGGASPAAQHGRGAMALPGRGEIGAVNGEGGYPLVMINISMENDHLW